LLDSYQKPSGAQYTGTVAFLVSSLIFGPAVLVLPRLSLGYLSVLPALALSLLCIALAWLNWKKYSQLAIPSLESCHAGDIGRWVIQGGNPLHVVRADDHNDGRKSPDGPI
jgi:hypothetical protein